MPDNLIKDSLSNLTLLEFTAFYKVNLDVQCNDVGICFRLLKRKEVLVFFVLTCFFITVLLFRYVVLVYDLIASKSWLSKLASVGREERACLV